MSTEDKTVDEIKFEGLEMSHDELLVKLDSEKQSAYTYQERRHDAWNETYQLYRDITVTNRLTQRQSVNVPLMKETIQTLYTKIDEDVDVVFENRDGDPDKELVVKEKWNADFNDNNFNLMDTVDKKTVLLYGRSHKKLNWVDGKFRAEVKDIFDVIVDPKTSPLDLESARFIVEQHIYKTLDWILENTKYNEDARNKLKTLKFEEESAQSGDVVDEGNQKEVDARNKRLEILGVVNLEEFSGSDIIISLDQHYTEIWNEESKKYDRWVCVVADGSVVLSAKKLKDALGVDFWPFTTWASDLEATDYWSDGEGDTLRVPNKIVNIWMSQYMENRTLRNYGMNFFDSTIEGFSPSVLEPRPGGWYGLPGKPNEVYQRVDIPELSGTLDDINFVVGMAERAVAATALDKGTVTPERKTLGEIEIAVSKSMERTNTLSRFYTKADQEFGEKWLSLWDANTTKETKTVLYRKDPSGALIPKTVTKKDWVTKNGYNVIAISVHEQLGKRTEELQRLFAIKQEFPDNPALEKTIKIRALKLANLSTSEIDEIITADQRRFEEQNNTVDQSVDENGLINTELEQPAELLQEAPVSVAKV